MNERNVEALVEALEESVPGGLIPGGFWEVARALASRGVLVPSALTDGEATNSVLSGFHEYGGPAYVRDQLDRVAKGEL